MLRTVLLALLGVHSFSCKSPPLRDLLSPDMQVLTVFPEDDYHLSSDLSFKLDSNASSQAKMALWSGDEAPAVVISEEDAFKFFEEELAVLAEMMFRIPIEVRESIPKSQEAVKVRQDMDFLEGARDLLTFSDFNFDQP